MLPVSTLKRAIENTLEEIAGESLSGSEIEEISDGIVVRLLEEEPDSVVDDTEPTQTDEED